MSAEEVFSCPHCRAPLTGLPGQRRVDCTACGSQVWCEAADIPALLMAAEVGASRARAIVTEALRQSLFLRSFGSKSRLREIALLFIPLYRIQGVVAGWSRPRTGGDYQIEDLLHGELACDVPGLERACLDSDVIEHCLTSGSPVKLDPVSMRRQGTVLLPDRPPGEHRPSTVGPETDLLEYQPLLVYLPVWQVTFDFQGMSFHSFVSAVDGGVIQLHGIKSNRKRLLLALAGIFALLTVFTRGMKLLLITQATPLMGVSLFLIVVGIPIAALMAGLLIPYFWRLFACKEELIRSGGTLRSRLIPLAVDDRAIPFIGKRLFAGLLEDENQWS